MKPSDRLQKARALIENRLNWCTGSLRNSSGQMCALGAVKSVSALSLSQHGGAEECDRRLPEHVRYLISAAAVRGEYSVSSRLDAIACVNDHYGHRATMEMFDMAISMAMSDEAASGQ